MKKKCLKVIISSIFLVLAFNAVAKENVGGAGSNSTTLGNNPGKSVNAQCVNATAQIDLDINNVRAKILNGGDMWWDIFATKNARYQIPKPTNSSTIGPSSQFASSVWVGGYDSGGQLKEAAQTYRQSGNDYWPGPLKDDATTDAGRCLTWDKFYKLNRKDVQAYFNWVVPPGGGAPVGANPLLSSATLPDAMDNINNWPAFGPEGHPLAPFYDYNGDNQYDPTVGDVPDFDVTGNRPPCTAQLYGDQSIFWVFNDKGNIHSETQGQAIGLEVQAQAFAFQTNDEINNATFIKYKLINKSSFELDSTFFGLWDDADLGDYSDDFVGCDVGLGLGMLFNGDAIDGTGQATAYGANPPAIGVDFFEGPKADTAGAHGHDRPSASVPASFLNYGNVIPYDERLGMCRFMYFNNDNNPVNGNPGPYTGGSSDDFYQYLSGSWKNGTPITYGGNGTTGSIPCKYMFPGTSDAPHYFGTDGNSRFGITPGIPQPAWDETTSNNTPADRRFLESAGPFILYPGAVNYITIGVPWARATQGGNLASVALLKGADTKVQQLFNNCFSTLNGPDAPNLAIQELDKQLILSWSNPATSTNANEKYSEDYDKSSGADSLYRFQGYMVYQLKDASVSATDLYNVDKARLIFQCDKKDLDKPNGAAQIINYTNDVAITALIPQEMVFGADKGIVHSISVNTDQFANGNNVLINHKTYYFAIIAYGYSPTQVPTNLNVLNDYSPFIAGRRYSDATFYHTAIPHIPSPEANGTLAQSSYGTGPKLTRIEGQGNGGMVLDFTSSTVDAILSSSTAQDIRPQYENSHGPVSIKVIDPLNVPENKDFRILIYRDTIQSRTSSHSVIGYSIKESSKWDLIDLNNHDTVHSERSIAIPNEQIINGQVSGSASVSIPRWGISVNIVYAFDPGVPGAVNNGFLEATMSFSDNEKQWLTGIPDAEGIDYHNWIRSGTFVSTAGEPKGFDDYGGKDDGQFYEKLLGGTWAPYRLAASPVPTAGTTPVIYSGGPAWNSGAAMGRALLKYLASTDIIITSDRSKWTRCPVIELQESTALAVGGVSKMQMRASQSVDKSGNPATVGSGTSTNPDAPNYNGETGMGWFPGYAVNLETGERLNMAFGEDSWLKDDNGRDMIWNPTSSDLSFSNGITPLFGGKHYIYVFGHNENKFFSNDAHFGNGSRSMPRYDGGSFMHSMLAVANTSMATGTNDPYARAVYQDAMWVSIPLLVPGHTLLESEVKIRLRVAKSYQPGYDETILPVADTSMTPINHNYPVYDFNTADIGTKKSNADAAANALDLINVVPNPYYAYSGYELTTAQNIVKITNLPEKCTVTIYTLSGTLVRAFKVDQPSYARDKMGIAVTSLDWDLKNQVRIPIASGLYIIHVDVPDVGEKTIKWFGVMRPIDLEAY